jgi:hypothetical protein
MQKLSKCGDSVCVVVLMGIGDKYGIIILHDMGPELWWLFNLKVITSKLFGVIWLNTLVSFCKR